MIETDPLMRTARARALLVQVHHFRALTRDDGKQYD